MKFVVTCIIRVITNSLTVKDISEEQECRHQLIMDLHNQSLTDKQITDYLNSHNIKTPLGKDYYYELVYVTRKKIERRDNWKNNTVITLENIQVCFN